MRNKWILLVGVFVVSLLSLVGSDIKINSKPLLVEKNLTFGEHIIDINREITDLMLVANEKIKLIPIEKWNNSYIDSFGWKGAIKKDISYVVVNDRIYVQMRVIHSYDLEIYDEHPTIFRISFVNVTFNKLNISTEDFGIKIVHPIPSMFVNNRFAPSEEIRTDYFLLENKTEEVNAKGIVENDVISYFFKRPSLHKISNVREYVKQIELEFYSNSNIVIHYYREGKQELGVLGVSKTTTTEIVMDVQEPVIEWEINFDYPCYGGNSVQPTSDQGYIIVAQDHLVKTDLNGSEQWNRILNGMGISVQQTSDNGYIITGQRDQDVWLIKTDSNGNKQWEGLFGGYDRDAGNSVQQTTDSGYIITGYKDLDISGSRIYWGNLYLIKTHPNGTKQWERTFGSRNDMDVGYSIQQTLDGGYIIASKMESYNSGLLKTDSTGNKEWQFGEPFFGGFYWGGAYPVIQINDEGYVFASDNRLIKIDPNQTIQWEKELNGSLKSVEQVLDGGYIMTGKRYPDLVYTARIDSNRDLLWERTSYTSILDIDGSYVVHQTIDGGYIIGACVNGDVYITKLSSDLGSPPSISNLPDKNISQDTKPDAKWIDLWNYVYDEDTLKEKLKFYIESQSNSDLIDCWIDVNRYITCDMPAKGQSGYSDVTIKVSDPQGLSDTDIFRINVIAPSLTILIIPFDWTLSLLDPDYQNYIVNSNAIAEYFLERIPLSDCSEQFKFITVKEDEDYGKYWDDWRCDASDIYFLGFEHCFTGGSALRRIYKCAEEYSKMKNEKYDFVVGVSNENIAYFDLIGLECDRNTAGWSDGEGDLLSVVSERGARITTHELGHEFGLDDQYCNCDDSLLFKSHCGTNDKVKYSKLRTELGCNASGDCCWEESPSPYLGCKWCDGNFDRFGVDADSDGVLDGGNKTAMWAKISLSYNMDQYDKYEYQHLQELPEFQCETQAQAQRIFTALAESTSNFNLQIMLNIDEKDNVELIELNFTEHEPFSIGEEEGEYSLKILDQDNLTLYEKNFSVDFVIFSDPPKITNESIIFEIVEYQDSMKKLEIYYNESLIFSHDIPSFCNSNGICESSLGENYLTCADCESNAIDSICNREKGDGCDFDCLDGLDSDCVDLTIENVILNGNLTKGKETQLRLNISNLGVRDAVSEFGLFLDSVLERNISINVSKNSSRIIEFNWTPQQTGIKDLIFLIDFKNIINEINETNNELKVENVTIMGLSGDVNGDCKVDIFDLAKIGLCYSCSSVQGCWISCQQADLSRNNVVDIFDLANVGLNYGRTC